MCVLCGGASWGKNEVPLYAWHVSTNEDCFLWHLCLSPSPQHDSDSPWERTTEQLQLALPTRTPVLNSHCRVKPAGNRAEVTAFQARNQIALGCNGTLPMVGSSHHSVSTTSEQLSTTRGTEPCDALSLPLTSPLLLFFYASWIPTQPHQWGGQSHPAHPAAHCWPWERCNSAATQIWRGTAVCACELAPPRGSSQKKGFWRWPHGRLDPVLFVQTEGESTDCGFLGSRLQSMSNVDHKMKK